MHVKFAFSLMSEWTFYEYTQKLYGLYILNPACFIDELTT